MHGRYRACFGSANHAMQLRQDHQIGIVGAWATAALAFPQPILRHRGGGDDLAVQAILAQQGRAEHGTHPLQATLQTRPIQTEFRPRRGIVQRSDFTGRMQQAHQISASSNQARRQFTELGAEIGHFPALLDRSEEAAGHHGIAIHDLLRRGKQLQQTAAGIAAEARHGIKTRLHRRTGQHERVIGRTDKPQRDRRLDHRGLRQLDNANLGVLDQRPDAGGARAANRQPYVLAWQIGEQGGEQPIIVLGQIQLQLFDLVRCLIMLGQRLNQRVRHLQQLGAAVGDHSELPRPQCRDATQGIGGASLHPADGAIAGDQRQLAFEQEQFIGVDFIERRQLHAATDLKQTTLTCQQHQLKRTEPAERQETGKRGGIEYCGETHRR